MIGGDHEDIVVAHLPYDLGQLGVEIRNGLRITVNVTSVAVKHIVINEVHEHDPLPVLVHIFYRLLDTVRIACRICMFCYAGPGEDIEYLAYRDRIHSGTHDMVKHRVRGRYEGKIMPVARPCVIAVASYKRPGYDASDTILADEASAAGPAYFIKFFKRDHVLMRRYLKHRICRSIYYELPGLHMLIAVIIYDLGTRIRFIAKHIPSGMLLYLINDFLRKTVGESRQRFPRYDTGYLPVSDRRILACGRFPHAGICTRRLSRSLIIIDPVYVKKTEFSEIIRLKFTAPVAGSHCICSGISELIRIGCVTYSKTVHHYQDHSFIHTLSLHINPTLYVIIPGDVFP